MRPRPLEEIARVLGGTLHGDGQGLVSAVDIDSRRIRPGSLFVALRGEHVDGHEFVAQAGRDGAVGALVERPVPATVPTVEVADARQALWQLGELIRGECRARIVAITGSNGKTTVKEMLASILGRRGRTTHTLGNFNNELGVPLTLTRLNPEDDYAVIELGANHAGEIDRLARLTRPHVGLVNNAGAAHLEGFGSIEGVANAKGEMYGALGNGDIAVINADDAYAPLWRELAGGRPRLEFGVSPRADVQALQPEVEGRFRLRTPAGETEVTLGLPGRHNIMNALAAAAAATALEVPLDDIATGLAEARGVAGRLQWFNAASGARVLDDTYNANPGSLQAALEVLAGAETERWMVLGDMAELGPAAADLHRQAGERARTAGVTRVYTVGEMARHAARAFGAGGHHYASHEALIEALEEARTRRPAILVKGSRSMGMERVVQALVGEGGGSG